MVSGSTRYSIALTEGLGDVLFGMSVTQVEEVLGRGDSATTYDLFDEWSFVLNYQGMALFFDSHEGFRLQSIEVGQDCQCTLFGLPLFPCSKGDVLRVMGENLSAEELEYEETSDQDLEESSLLFRGLASTFYFDLEGNLQELHWGVRVGADGVIEWPAAGT